MKINVNEAECIGCGFCVGQDPEHFDFNDNGFAVVKSNEGIDADAMQSIIDACPTSAIVNASTDTPAETGGCDCSSCPGCGH